MYNQPDNSVLIATRLARYLEQAVIKEASRVRDCPDGTGTGNCTLNQAAYSLATLGAAVSHLDPSLLPAEKVRQHMLEAISGWAYRVSGDEDAQRQTIDSAIDAGWANPRDFNQLLATVTDVSVESLTTGSNKSENPNSSSHVSPTGGSAPIAATTPGSGAWETPVPLRPAPGPELDVQRLGGIAPMAEAVAASLQVPIDLAAWFGIVAIATAVGGRRYVCPKPDWHEPVTIYTMTICEPGEMKSPTLKAMTAPLYDAEESQQLAVRPEIESDQQRRRISEARKKAAEERAGRAKAEDLNAAMADAEAAAMALQELGEPRAFPEFFADDATPEALAAKMHEQGGRLAVLSAEGSFLGNTAGRYSDGKANPEIVLKAWSHERHPVDRMGRRLVIKRPSLAIGLAPQPGLLTGLGKSADVFDERGLFARFLLFLPTSRVGTRSYDSQPVPQHVATTYAARLSAVVDRVWADDRYVEMTLDQMAAESFRTFWNSFESRHLPGGDLVGIEAWSKKFPGQLLRIAALVTLFDDPDSVTICGRVVDDVISLVPYLISNARHAADLMSSPRQSSLGPARALLTWLERRISDAADSGEAPFTIFTARDAFNGVHNQQWAHRGGMDAVNRALVLLEDRFYLRPKPQEHPGPGRPPSPAFEINPAVASHARRGSDG